MRDSILDQVAVRGEILELVNGVVEGHHGGFARWPHHGLREENAGFAHLRQEGSDARTGLDQNHQRDGVAREIEVGDLLGHAIVRNVKIVASRL